MIIECYRRLYQGHLIHKNEKQDFEVVIQNEVEIHTASLFSNLRVAELVIVIQDRYIL